MKVLVTGAAGFIGFHLCKKLIERGDIVTGLDNINDYYDLRLKYGRLTNLGIDKDQIEYGKKIKSLNDNFKFIKLDLDDRDNLYNLFKEEGFDAVCNLAAQAGVRYSLENPQAYIDSNINGFINILESCRNYNVNNLSYASSSSVYGLNKSLPFSTNDNVDHPISLYAASKKSNELMAHTYSHLFNISSTGLRFFTVYGPWGRPDMALFLFTKAALSNQPIKVFNNGEMRRDFTYVDDIIEGVVRVIDNPASSNKLWDPFNSDPSSSSAPYKIYNIGNSNPVNLVDFINAIENILNIKIEKKMLPLQPGDVTETYANVEDLVEDLNYKPSTPLIEGVENFINWYKRFYNAW